MTNEIRVFKVIWDDPHSIDEWAPAWDVVASPPCRIVSVGIFIYEDVDRIVLALNADLAGEELSCTMLIPKRCVVSVSEVACVKKVLDP
jgi:hypothetical protein